MIKFQPPQRPRSAISLKFSELPDEAFITLGMVCDITGKRTTSVYDAIKRHTFPSPERFGSRCSRWRVGEIRRWLRDPFTYKAIGKV